MLDGLEEVLAARVGLAPAPLIPIPNFTPEWASWRSHSRFQSKGMVPTRCGIAQTKYRCVAGRLGWSLETLE